MISSKQHCLYDCNDRLYTLTTSTSTINLQVVSQVFSYLESGYSYKSRRKTLLMYGGFLS